MKFAISLFGLAPRHHPRIATAAEALGFEAVLVPEHLVFPARMPPIYPYNAEDGLPPMSSDTPAYDPLVLLGAMAAVTERITLGTCVYVLPLRHPIAVARSLVTLDRLSGGRIIAGVGAGWLVDEFEIMGIDPRPRGRRMDEAIALIRRTWSGADVIEHHGEFFDLAHPITFEPKPLRGAIPIHVGGTSARALRRAGELGDGWMYHRPVRSVRPTDADREADLGELRRSRDVIEEHRLRSRRADAAFEVTAGFGDQVADVEAAQRAGVDRYSVGPGAVGPEGFVAWMEQFAEGVMRRFPAAP